MKTKTAVQNLVKWFEENKRPLPWRKGTNPYKIWISETMLQQTTSTAVIPYYKRFIKKFPTLKSLAESQVEDVIEHWAGLGYYSRAKNLHKAAIELNKLSKFPESHEDLLKFSGIGQYTSRAVSSIAFNEPVGVIDGNTIRVFSRLYDKGFAWWTTTGRKEIQDIADNWALHYRSSTVNQSLMELGATLCTPKNPKCILCPVSRHCLGLKNKNYDTLPIKRPKKQKQIIKWTLEVPQHRNQIGFVENDYAPFLKRQLVFPGKIKVLTSPPKRFKFKHMITHYEIYVEVSTCKTPSKLKKYKWLKKDEIKKFAPASVLQKAMANIK